MVASYRWSAGAGRPWVWLSFGFFALAGFAKAEPPERDSAPSTASGTAPPRAPALSVWIRPGWIDEELRPLLAALKPTPPGTGDPFTLEGVRMDRPLLMAAYGDWRDTTAFAFTPDPRRPAPTSALWCTPRTSEGKESVTLCGASAADGVDARALLDAYEGKNAGADVVIESRYRDASVLRSVLNVRRDVTSLLSAEQRAIPPLAKEPAAVHLLSELRYDFAHALAEAYERLEPLRIALDVKPDGRASFRAALAPAPATRWSVALGEADERPIAKAFWDLPEDLDAALSLDARFVTGVLRPSPRAGALAAQVAQGGAFAGLLASATAAWTSCSAPPEGVVVGFGTARRHEREKPSAETPDRSYTLLGIPQRGAACGKALSKLLDHYVALGAPATAEEPAALRRLSPRKGFPKLDLLASLPDARGERALGLLVRPNVVWLGWAKRAESLAAPFAALGAAREKTGRIAARPELAGLRTGKALAFGFTRDRELLAHLTWFQSDEAPNREAPRVPFSLRRDGQKLVLGGELDPATTRRLAAFPLQALAGRQGRIDATVRQLEAACALGSDDACYAAGRHHFQGEDVPKDVERARALLTPACARDHVSACIQLGELQTEAAPAEAKRSFQRSCELDSPNGCNWYGQHLLSSSDEADQRLAADPLRWACDHREEGACLGAALQYANGKGVEKDQGKAADYYERGCKLDEKNSCSLLGQAYADGAGRKQDLALAFRLYSRGCQLGHQLGCFAAAASLLRGNGVPRDREQAKRLFTKSCDAGHAESCRVLGQMAGGEL